jgi:hypothetical protein
VHLAARCQPVAYRLTLASSRSGAGIRIRTISLGNRAATPERAADLPVRVDGSSRG